MSEWTPGQTSINIRGAATEGQGRDFKSQVLVLINGHRAGTANISKLSIADIERIEIVRGPSSVIYGSQNMGGVINIILKTGLTAPGNVVEGRRGLVEPARGQGRRPAASHGLRLVCRRSRPARATTTRSAGGAPELNTAWTRYGATGAFGYQIDENNRIEVHGAHATASTMPASAARAPTSSPSTTRYNHSFDPSYLGQDARRAGQRLFPGLLRHRRRRSQQSLAAQRAQCARRHAPRPTTTAASSTSSARASSRATSCSPATSCCSASTGSAAGCAPTAIAWAARR